MWLPLLVAGLVLGSGCSDDDGDPVDPPVVVVGPETPIALMADFAAAMQAMEIDPLTDLVHTDAKVFLLPSTLQEWSYSGTPLDFTYFGRDSLLAVHANIFAGQVGRDAAGVTVPPVASLQISLLNQTEQWAAYADPEADFPGLEVQVGRFQVLLYFNNPDQHRFEIRCDVDFYATLVDEPNLTGWQLLGWREYQSNGQLQATATTAWGDILTIYR